MVGQHEARKGETLLYADKLSILASRLRDASFGVVAKGDVFLKWRRSFRR